MVINGSPARRRPRHKMVQPSPSVKEPTDCSAGLRMLRVA